METIREALGGGSPDTLGDALRRFWRDLGAGIDGDPAALTRMPAEIAEIADGMWQRALKLAGEVAANDDAAARVSDIDWRHERLRIRHTKTGAHSELPLLPGPAVAILKYLKCGRPPTTLREVFVRARAPYRAITSHCALRRLVTRKLQDGDVVLTGKRGSHVFRHSRAVSLLRNGVPIKVIGDLLGHRSERSTGAYLKLATEDLRSVALDLPAGVSP